jgi:hypothetical protein
VGESISSKSTAPSRQDDLAIAANLVASELDQASIAAPPQVQARLLGLELQILGTEDQVTIPDQSVIDDGSCDVGIDSLDEGMPGSVCRLENPNLSFASDNKIAAIGGECESRSTWQRKGLVEPR